MVWAPTNQKWSRLGKEVFSVRIGAKSATTAMALVSKIRSAGVLVANIHERVRDDGTVHVYFSAG